MYISISNPEQPDQIYSLRADRALFGPKNRAFRYGDAIFESMTYQNERVQLWGYHCQRLFAACKTLGFGLPPSYTADWLHGQIANLVALNRLSTARIRLTVYRADGGWYAPQSEQAFLLIEAYPQNTISWADTYSTPCIVGICPTAQKAYHTLSHLKTSNALPYIMAARWAREQGHNDALLLNPQGELVEATAANIWLIRAGCAHTPPLQSGCIAGVMRQFLLDHLPQIGIAVAQTSLCTADLYQADELWLSNAIQGIRRITQCEQHRYASPAIDISPVWQYLAPQYY